MAVFCRVYLSSRVALPSSDRLRRKCKSLTTSIPRTTSEVNHRHTAMHSQCESGTARFVLCAVTGADIANHFCEHFINYHVKQFPHFAIGMLAVLNHSCSSSIINAQWLNCCAVHDKYPDKAHQMRFLKAYLHEYQSAAAARGHGGIGADTHVHFPEPKLEECMLTQFSHHHVSCG